MTNRFVGLGLAVVVSVITTGCSGMRKTNDTFATHAESFRIVGFTIPEDDQAAAARLVPPGAKVESVSSTSADWTSVIGVIGNIIGIHQTTIAGTMPSHGGK